MLTCPPIFFLYMPGDPDWQARYDIFNMPGNYHNGGIWPFVCGFYVAALVAAKKYTLANQKLIELTRIVKLTHTANVSFGFNEWIKAQDGKPMGQDWQTWSAAMYLYAAKCVEEKILLFLMRCENELYHKSTAYKPIKICE
jgi:glycogen debranching enzyme